MTSNIRIGRRFGVGFVLAGLSVLFLATIIGAQSGTPAPTAGSGLNLTATSANVNDAGGAVKINLLRWSTDEERNAIVKAMTPPTPGSAPAAAPAGGAAGGRGGGGRGGRGGPAAPAGPVDPIVALTAAIEKAPSLGFLWTTESLGYSIRYAYHASLPDGTERVILATDRRLGSTTPGAWKPAAPSTPTSYEFTVIELKLDPKGVGEGKTSLNTKVMVDTDAKTLALENYTATPAILKNVKR